MKTVNRAVYHCQCCGKVVHCALDSEPPRCCDAEMAQAAQETIEWPVEEIAENPECGCVPLAFPDDFRSKSR